MNVNKIKIFLKKLASSQKARLLQRFFKTAPGEYGEGDKFLGVVVPDIRKVVKMCWQDTSLREAEQLLHSAYHEERLTALLILVKKFENGTSVEQNKIFRLYLKNLKKYINNWDLVDLTAPRIIGVYLADKNKEILGKLARSKNLWERRAAILSTFAYIVKDEPEEAISIANILLNDEHDLIHKAVGWMLREVGKRCSISVLIDFLKKHAHKMPRTMLRYAIERLPRDQRVFWLRYKKKMR